MVADWHGAAKLCDRRSKGECETTFTEIFTWRWVCNRDRWSGASIGVSSHCGYAVFTDRAIFPSSVPSLAN
jgi:hypothetical protein